jgi:Fur family zinc uptake transcriptional regulator
MSTTASVPSHNHQHCINRALDSAQKICQEKAIRLTPIRQRIFELIWSSHKAVGAYDLLKTLQHEDPNAKPVTIYRALDFLLAAGLIHKVASLNAFIGCSNPETKHNSVLLICDCCQDAKEVEAQAIYEAIWEISKKNTFQPQQLTLELHGVCEECQQTMLTEIHCPVKSTKKST